MHRHAHNQICITQIPDQRAQIFRGKLKRMPQSRTSGARILHITPFTYSAIFTGDSHVKAPWIRDLRQRASAFNTTGQWTRLGYILACVLTSGDASNFGCIRHDNSLTSSHSCCVGSLAKKGVRCLDTVLKATLPLAQALHSVIWVAGHVVLFDVLSRVG